MVRFRIVPLLSIVFIMVVTFIRHDLILSGISSLVFTALYSLLHFQIHPLSARADLLQYWIAAAVWCSALVISCRSLFNKKVEKNFVKRMVHSLTPAWSPDRSTVAKLTLGLYGLFLFVGIALLAPFLAPLDPDNQGDLETTRFLAPLRTAVVRHDVSMKYQHESAESAIVAMLQRANNILLSKKVDFRRQAIGSEETALTENTHRMVFLFGTDAMGRDVFSRVVYGTRISLGIGIIVASLSMMIGMWVGFLSGIMGGVVDSVIMRLIDVLLSFPTLILIIALFAVLGGSIEILIIALALTGWMGVARLVRGEVLKLREQEFILSARLLGVSSMGIIRNHLLPNILPIIVTASVLQLVNSIMGEAALSFLGMGIQPPTPSWGNMIGESMIYLRTAWWIGVFPGIALSLFAVSAQVVAEGIQECHK
jgi:peptide/nickel transport system permease protein